MYLLALFVFPEWFWFMPVLFVDLVMIYMSGKGHVFSYGINDIRMIISAVYLYDKFSVKQVKET